MKAESETSGENRIGQDVITLAGILLILAAPVAKWHDDQRIERVRLASIELRALADSGAPVEELRRQALAAIALAENSVAAQMREVVPASALPHTISAKVVRFKFLRGSRHTSPPPAALTPPDDEIARVRKSSELLLATLADLRRRITGHTGTPELAASPAPVAHGLRHRRSHVPMAR